MTSIVSTISGQFSKTLVLGTLLPTAVFVLLAQWWLGPIVPSSWTFLKPITLSDTGWQVLFLTLAVVTLSGLLYHLNIPLIRLYEGYPWLESQIGQFWVERFRTKFRADEKRWKDFFENIKTLEKRDPQALNLPKLRREWATVGQRLKRDYPSEEISLLPTQLGNVIRSFEYYAYWQYGMDPINLWPRLSAKIDKDYAAGMEDTKASMDFMLNAATLCGLLAVALLVAGLWWLVPFKSGTAVVGWVVQMLALTVLARLLYYGAISSAYAWGDLVRSAFDMYRRDLLKQIGYTEMPTSIGEERFLWKKISQQMIYGDQPTVRMAQYISQPTFACSDPPGMSLNWHRHIEWNSTFDTANIKISVVNNDTRPTQRILVKDTLPPGLEYVWQSAIIDNKTVFVQGTNPYHFSVSVPIAVGKYITLSYTAKRPPS
jgi:uncharacterized repeat protein (TIGR01451 family)